MDRQSWLNSASRSVPPEQVFHVGQLFSLQSLNLSHNFLSDITRGGLSGCEALTELDVSHNRIAGVDNIEHLALMPSLLHLRMHDNPISADKFYR